MAREGTPCIRCADERNEANGWTLRRSGGAPRKKGVKKISTAAVSVHLLNHGGARVRPRGVCSVSLSLSPVRRNK